MHKLKKIILCEINIHTKVEKQVYLMIFKLKILCGIRLYRHIAEFGNNY